jgi:uncharacterized protein (DUF302 family)
MNMDYIVHSQKTVTQASEELESKVMDSGFRVIHVHNIGQKSGSNGTDNCEEIKIFDIYKPAIAGEINKNDIPLNMALHYRISVYTEQGYTKIGLIKPILMLELFSEYPNCLDEANSIEKKLIQIMQDVK